MDKVGISSSSSVTSKQAEVRVYLDLLSELDPIEQARAVATGSLVDAMIETENALADILNRGGGQPPSPGAVGIEG